MGRVLIRDVRSAGLRAGSRLQDLSPKTVDHPRHRSCGPFGSLSHISRLSKNCLQRENCRHEIANEDLIDALSLDQGEGWGVGFRTAARYSNALAQKENLDPERFRQARLHPLPNPLP